ncbi:MAG: phosphatase PAP2 family protein [Geminicoccaceae bacterium]|nr:phosphatase PAP2 family protein [Geminicoccaceae bacterium]
MSDILRRILALALRFYCFVELRTVVVLAIVALSGWLFVTITDEVVLEQEFTGIDRAILLSLRTAGDPSDPIGPGWLEEALRDVTGLGGFTIILIFTVMVAGYCLMIRLPSAALLVLLSIVGAIALSTGMKSYFERARPDLVPHNTVVYTASFPSGHSTGAAATYLTLGALLASIQRRRRLRVYIMSWAVGLTIAIGFSRIYLGVHWPSDVLAGWSLGAGWAALCWFVLMQIPRLRERAITGAMVGRDAEPAG